MYKNSKYGIFCFNTSYYLLLYNKNSPRVAQYSIKLIFSGRQSKLSFEELTKWAHDSDICFVELEVNLVD